MRLPIARSSRSCAVLQQAAPDQQADILERAADFAPLAPLRSTLTAAAIPAWSYTFSAYSDNNIDAHRIGVVGGELQPLEDRVAGLGFQLEDAVGLRLHAVQRREALRVGSGAW